MLLQQYIFEPELYADIIFRVRKIIWNTNLSEELNMLLAVIKIHVYLNIDIMRPTVCTHCSKDG